MVLGTTVNFTRWRALILLMLGVMLVASASFTTAPTGGDRQRVESKQVSTPKVVAASPFSVIPSKFEESAVISQMIGYGAVMGEVVLSGFASVYFESVIKSTQENVSIWVSFSPVVFGVIGNTYVLIYVDYFTHKGAKLSVGHLQHYHVCFGYH